jgi:hypothetical protein
LFAMKMAIIATYVFWIILLLPILWSYEPRHYDVPNEHISFYLIDIGEFTTNEIMKTFFTYSWALIGYFLPVTVLAFCNIKLIQTLRESSKWRECSARSAPSGREANIRITTTLVALILMFLILISPSELLHFYKEVGQPIISPELALMCTNLLQTLNFALHFILYCVVNVTFRRTLVNALYMVTIQIRGRAKEREFCCRKSLPRMRRQTCTFKSNETQL